MGLKLYYGASGAGKSYQLYQEVIKRSMEQPEQRFFIIVPDQFTMQTQKDIVMLHPMHGIMNIDVLSFGRLSHRIFEETGSRNIPVLDDTGKSLVLRKVIQNLSEELPVIGGNLKKTGYIHEVKSAISEFMQYGISVQDMGSLAEAAKSRGALYYKLKDLEVLYKGFCDYTKERFVTTEETLDILAAVLGESELIQGSVVVFDGFTGFTPVQNKVIRELLRLCNEVIVTVLMDERENPHLITGEQELFYLSKKTVSSLEKLAKEAGASLEQSVFIPAEPGYRFFNNKELAHLEKNIFRYPEGVYREPCEKISIKEMANPREEIRETALAIRRLVREENYCYRDIAVIAGDLGGLEAYVEEEFKRLEIPFFMDRTKGIVLNPFIEYMKSALRIIEQNFTYESVFHFLRSGMADTEPPEVDRLENYVLACGIRGRRAWSSLFTKKSREMRGENSAETLEALNRTRESLMRQLAPLMGKAGTAEEHVLGLYAFLTENHAEERLLAYEQFFTKQGDLTAAGEYAQIYRLVMELLEQIMELLAKETMSRKEFMEILEAGFLEIKVGSIPKQVDRVVVGDMERTRLKQVKALFMIGINDGNIPKSSTGGGIISDIDREFLAGADYELSPTPRQKMYIQRLYLYMNMTKPSERLILSYVRSAGDGKAKKPSYLIRVVQDMFPALEIRGGSPKTVWDIETMGDGLSLLTNELRDYAACRLRKESEPVFFLLYDNYRKNEEYGELAERLAESAFYMYSAKRLNKETAELLYGQVLLNSVSRLEKFASCAYAHFLRYALTLEEREEYSFEDTDMGNVFHDVLEHFAEELSGNGYTWFDFPKEAGEEMVEKALARCAAEYKDTLLFSSAKNRYAITRMERILKRTVATLQYQLRKGAFKPKAFEVSFSVQEDLEAVNIALTEKEKMRLLGRIDRIDTAEAGDSIYVKVIDYKSGSKSFDIVSLYYGLQLQLVAYLNVAVDLEKKAHPDKNIIPAAVLYYHVADPMIQGNGEQLSPEALNERLLKELCATGLVNTNGESVELLDKEFLGKSDVIPVERKKDGSLAARSSIAEGDGFEKISNYVNQKIKDIGTSIIQGDIEINPYEKGQQSACTYCTYKSVCGFDEKIEGFSKRKLELSGEEAMERILETEA